MISIKAKADIVAALARDAGDRNFWTNVNWDNDGIGHVVLWLGEFNTPVPWRDDLSMPDYLEQYVQPSIAALIRSEAKHAN